jgi:hypothetical protein
MKLLPILLLAFVLSLGVACSSEEPDCSSSFTRYPAGHRCAPEPTPTPEPTPAPTYSEGEAIGLVQGMLRSSRLARYCSQLPERGNFSAQYIGEGVWEVKVSARLISGYGYYAGILKQTWRVHEGSNAVERGEGTRIPGGVQEGKGEYTFERGAKPHAC